MPSGPALAGRVGRSAVRFHSAVAVSEEVVAAVSKRRIFDMLVEPLLSRSVATKVPSGVTTTPSASGSPLPEA